MAEMCGSVYVRNTEHERKEMPKKWNTLSPIDHRPPYAIIIGINATTIRNAGAHLSWNVCIKSPSIWMNVLLSANRNVFS